MRRMPLLVALLAIGCHNPVSPNGDLRGSWAGRLPLQFLPDSSWSINLTQNGDSIAGTGTYKGASGRSGSLNVSGDVHGPLGGSPTGPTITLLLTYDIGQTWAFTGQLSDPEHMTGILSLNALGGPADTLTFVHE